MKRTWKRIVAMVSMLAVVFSMNVNVSAINTSEVNSKLNSLMNQYVGTTWNGYYYGSQCKGFANLIFQKLFNVTHIGPYEESGKYYIASPSGATEIGRLSPSQMTQAKATALLKKGAPGDFIQVRRRNKTYGHSMILVSANSSNITVFDCNSDGKNGVRKYNISYADFYSKNSAMSLYHAKNYSSTPVLSYCAHVADKGWLKTVSASEIAGTTGQARQMESLIVNLTYNGKSAVEVTAHVADKGWLRPVGSGVSAGTVGECRRMEAVKIRLTNGLEKLYDIEYRVHCRDLGYLPWVRNNAVAGTVGRCLPIEAIQIRLVRK